MNDVGTPLLPFHEPLKPTWTEAFVPTEPFHGMLVTVTWEPDVEWTPFHSCWIPWPSGNAQRRSHDDTGSPRLVTVTLAPKPPGHWLLTA